MEDTEYVIGTQLHHCDFQTSFLRFDLRVILIPMFQRMIESTLLERNKTLNFKYLSNYEKTLKELIDLDC